MTDDIFKMYYELRDETDERAELILSYYRDDITCAAKCSSCCIPISIFPVEFYAIKNELGIASSADKAYPDADTGAIVNKSDENCFFLKNSLCTIYRSRPLICRTQGLPLLYFSDDLQEYTIAVCGKNFTRQDNDFDFDTDYAIDLDRLNSSLFKLNTLFLNRKKQGNIPAGVERIPVEFLSAF